jgi:hypothetical protein
VKSVVAAVFALVMLAADDAAAKPEVNQDAVCRAAIATLGLRDPKTVNVSKHEGDVAHLGYRRESDGKWWFQRCKLEGNQVIWAWDEIQWQNTGRWRTHPNDGKVLFEVDAASGIKIILEHGDGSKTERYFSREDLVGK